MAGTLWAQTTTSSAMWKMAISRADHCLSTITASFPSAEDITVYIIAYTPAGLLRDYAAVKTWACFGLPAGTNEKKVNLLPLFSYLDFENISIHFVLCIFVFLGRAALMGNGDKCLSSTGFVCLQSGRALQLWMFCPASLCWVHSYAVMSLMASDLQHDDVYPLFTHFYDCLFLSNTFPMYLPHIFYCWPRAYHPP